MVNLDLSVGELAFIDISTSKHPDAVAMIDAADLPGVLDGFGRWRAHRPSGSTTLYAVRWYGPRKARRLQLLHRELVGLAFGDPECADHKNTNGLDNRRSNLRRTTQAKNAMNVRKCLERETTSRFKGVSFRGGNWRVYIREAGRQRHLGVFASEEKAARAYDAAARALHGEFARTNFTGQDDGRPIEAQLNRE